MQELFVYFFPVIIGLNGVLMIVNECIDSKRKKEAELEAEMRAKEKERLDAQQDIKEKWKSIL